VHPDREHCPQKVGGAHMRYLEAWVALSALVACCFVAAAWWRGDL